MKKFVHLQFNCNNKSEHAKNTLLIDNNQIPIHLKKRNMVDKHLRR